MWAIQPGQASLRRDLPGGGIVYLLRDLFTTTEAAPLASPRTCEPGPGTLTITDTLSTWSISGSEIVSSAVTTGARDPWLRETTGYARAAGRTFAVRVKRLSTPGALGNDWCIGWVNTLTNPNLAQLYGACLSSGAPYGIFMNNADANNPLAVDTGALDTYFAYAFVLRATGYFLIIDSTLVWVGANGADATLFPSVLPRVAAARNVNQDDWKVIDLSAPWSDAYGIATSRTAAPATGATGTQTANGHVEFTWTPAASETLDLMVRHVDDNNCWIVRGDQAGATIKLIEKAAGVETERSSAAQTWTAAVAKRIVVICAGNTINSYVANIAKNAYASAAFQNTATGIKVAGFATGAELVSWPRAVTLPAF